MIVCSTAVVGRWAAAAQAADAAVPAVEQRLNDWRILPNGAFRGKLPTGLVIEFEGQIVGATEPGVVLGPAGSRYILGTRALDSKEGNDAASTFTQFTSGGVQMPDISSTDGLLKAIGALVAAVASATAAVTVASSVATSVPVFVQSNVPPALGGGAVTKTNVTVVETKRTLPDGTLEKIVDKTTRREKIRPGKAPLVTETTKRTDTVGDVTTTTTSTVVSGTSR
eukprot:TRINITY_DN10223_c0_g1_i2.p1 TRINITY_DN10223_c0_g1~~TRINITY_DN10223_c0_g1_i2.p1  ORF type:complete len:225 (+),score=52.69 TRINITY_DN10223_c0_g1_i2:84-758(+)